MAQALIAAADRLQNAQRVVRRKRHFMGISAHYKHFAH
jgi:hypothetical protein